MEDDASRYLLECGKFDAKTEDNNIAPFQKMVQDYREIYPIGELIIDRGSEYGAHRTDEKGDWNSEFKNIVEEASTKTIRIRVNHPQSNGKVEKAFHPYIKYRNEFHTVEDYIYRYNNTRPHESLGTKRSPLETPKEASWRKLPTECLLVAACRLFGW
jgi:transposase InsO family protein